MTNERGDIISSWLVQLLLFMAVVGLFGYELLSVSITTLTLDGDAEQVADVAADAYERDEDLEAAEDAAGEEATRRETTVADVHLEDNWVSVTVVKQAPTLLVHHIPGLEGVRDVASTRRSRWDL